MKKMPFKSILKFTFKGKHYEMFKTSNEQIAFLKITENGYDYPTIQEFEELTNFFEKEKEKNISFLKNETKYRFIPCIKGKLNGKVTTVAITSMLVLSTLTGCKNTNATNFNYATIEVENTFENNTITNDTKTKENNTIANDEEVIKDLSTSKINELLNNSSDSSWIYENDIQDIVNFDASTIDYVNDSINKKIYLFNNKYFDLFFNNHIYNNDELAIIINENQNIPNEYKDFIKDFTKTMLDYYPNIDTRIYAENLKTISIEEKEENEFNNDSEAYYDTLDKKIVVKGKIDLDNILNKIILRHELGHLFNNISYNYDDYNVIYYFNYNNHGYYLKEGLNVLFTTKPFDEEYKAFYINKGYPLLANTAEIITDAIDYDFNNYVSQNVYGFENEVNLKSNNPIGFNYIEDIYENLWYDYITFAHLDENNELVDDFSIDQEYYHDFYEYITKLYLNKYYNENLSDEELKNISSDYIRILTNNISNFNVVDYDTIKDTFNNYTLDKESSLTK